jgi:signal transduction histidine kinase
VRLGSQIRLYVLLTGVVPLLVLAFAASGVAREELERVLTREQVGTAAQLAASLGEALDEQERVLAAQLGSFRLDVAPDEARAGFLVSTWRLLPSVTIALLTDAGGGDATAPVYAIDTEDAQGHQPASARRVAQLRAALPDPSAGVVRGAAYLPEGSADAAVPVVFASPWGDGLSLGVEMSLGPLRPALERAAGEDGAALLVDLSGEVLLVAGNSPMVDPARLAPLLRSRAADARVDDEVIVATAKLPGRELVAVVAASASTADAVVRRTLQPTWYIGVISLVAAAVGGTLLGRSITEPVSRLRDAAKDVGEGHLERRVDVDGKNELAELSTSFNQMTELLELNRTEIAAKSLEIEAFNRELQARVEARTRALVEAQSRLVASSQLAAVAEMSGGLAHELNNPLAGLLGIVQFVKLKRAGSPEEALLASAEAEALRCKEIVASLLRFTGPPSGNSQRAPVPLGPLLRDVVGLASSSFRRREVSLVLAGESTPLVVFAHPEELGRSLSQVLGALRTAAAPGATLTVEVTRAGEGENADLLLRLDRTHDIQDDWRAAALGLWAARRTLNEDGCSLEDVQADGGRTWRVRIPLAKENE